MAQLPGRGDKKNEVNFCGELKTSENKKKKLLFVNGSYRIKPMQIESQDKQSEKKNEKQKNRPVPRHRGELRSRDVKSEDHAVLLVMELTAVII